MKNTVNEQVKQFAHARQVRRRFLSIVLILALVVSLGVFWQLHSDGVAMANETFCGMEEHTHGEECYEQVLTCGLEESDEPDGHTHTDACYESVLTCDIPEHTHTVDCLIDETADVEEAADWEATLPDNLTDDQADNVVAIAQSQIGYTESEANFRLAEDGQTRQGYTRYGAWYGNEYGDWDAMFASFCLHYAGVDEEEFPQNGGAYAWTLALSEMENADETGETILLADAEDSIPAPGDLVFFDRGEEDDVISMDGAVDHVGIVETVETEPAEGDTEDAADEENIQKLTVIEGNSNDAVERVEYDYTSEDPADIEAVATIAGYAILPGQTEVEVPEAEVVEEVAEVADEEGVQTLADDAADASEPAETAWTGETSGKVVLNLGNGNGKYNFADYTGYKTSGTLLRYTTDSLADYADDDGNVKINLPSDNDLDKTFTVVDEMNGLSAITFALGNATAFDYELVGWVNIATGEYYDVSGGAATATVNLDNENVFYADWIAATYNLGSSTDAYLRTDTVSTADFVTMHMYDFNELYNLYSESLVQNGTDSEEWTDSGNLYNELPYGSGERLTSSFLFVNDGTTSTAAAAGGMLSWPTGKTAGNTWTGTGEPPLDATDTWGILSPSSPPMNMLYDRSAGLAGVHYVGDADYLFWLDDDGYYTYNSKEAAATYNQSEQRFYVYDKPLYVKGTDFSCFLPFNEFVNTTKGTNKNSHDTPYSATDGSVDYWFGMDMEVDFYLPNATGAKDSEGKYGNRVGDKDMVFTFSGDDDILIFIDDVLVLDMSGIHDESFGSINFADGTVTMGMSMDDNTGKITDGTTTEINDGKGLSAGNHELQIYYMERGGYASNLEIQFNVVPLWEYQTGEVQTVTAEKTWVDAQGNTIDPENLPDAYKNNGVEVGLFDVLPEADPDAGVIGYTKDGTKYTFSYEDDAGLSHTFVYDSSVPSLTYTEGDGDPIVFRDVDDEGRILDTYGHVVCWLEEDTGLLHMRMDTQELNSDNGWYYAWELLDADGDYEVLELSESSSYTTSSVRKDLTSYEYWSVIGDYEIENEKMLDGLHPVLLTEAAQEAGNVLGDTKEAMGWVILGNAGSIDTKQIKFSQIATLEEVYDENNIVKSYLGTYGVTSQSEVAALGEGALWYMVDSNHLREGVEGELVEGFYLHCVLNGTNYYLTLTSDEHALALTTQEAYESEFYYDALGELMVILRSDEDQAVRVEIMEDGTINIGDAETQAAIDDVRIYALRDTDTSGFSFTAYNIFLPDITLQKVDSVTESTLTGVSFSLMDADSELYYGGVDPETDEVIWSEEKQLISTDEGGEILFRYMSDGEYILTEEAPLDGYAALPSAIQIVVEDGVVGSVTWANGNTEPPIENYVTVSTDDGITITVENTTGAELPNAGGMGTTIFYIIGILIAGGVVFVLLTRRRRNMAV